MKLYIRSSSDSYLQEEMDAIEHGGFDAVRNRHIKEDYFSTRKSSKPNLFKVVVEEYPVIRDKDGYITEFEKAPYGTWEASSIEEAQDMVTFFIREKNLGGSTFTGGKVYDLKGNLIGRVAYNGRFWGKDTDIYSSSNVSELQRVARELKSFLRNQPNVENVGADIIRDYMLITIALSDGTVIDDWDEKLSDIPEDFDQALNYLIDRFETVKNNR